MLSRNRVGVPEGVPGHILIKKIIHLVSLMVERLPSKQSVKGSSPLPGEGLRKKEAKRGLCGRVVDCTGLLNRHAYASGVQIPSQPSS